MIDNDRYIFLLGGHDLEMVEIRKILESNELVFFDDDLSWGAKLSSYAKQFNNSSIFVGIELIKDVPLPEKYIEIDHHNEKAHLPSSLEQVAGLLGIELNHWQQLVAANDKGYIPALMALSATPHEIKQIRSADRKAQGATDADEKLADSSILNHMKKYNDLIIIEALTSKFSIICDKLYPFGKLLIYTEDELVYYGAGVEEVSNKFKNEYDNNIFYSGGGDDGFWGIGRGMLPKEDILKIVKNIKDSFRNN